MKKFVITMILILLGQATFSQIVTTDTKNQTITLDRDAAIDKAKIIENEKALYQENSILKDYIKQLEFANSNLQLQVVKLEKDIVGGKDELIAIQNSIIDGYKNIQKIEDKNSNYGFYLNTGYGLNNLGFNIGASYIAQKMSYTVLYNPMLKSPDGTTFPSLQFNIGIKLF